MEAVRRYETPGTEARQVITYSNRRSLHISSFSLPEELVQNKGTSVSHY
jgi:hypothetical protein